MEKNKIIALVTILFILVIALLTYGISRESFHQRSKAASATSVDLGFIGESTIEYTAGKEYNYAVRIIRTDATPKIAAARIVFTFPDNIFMFNNITYSDPFMRLSLGGDGIISDNKIAVMAEAKRDTNGALLDQTNSMIIATINLKVKPGVTLNSSGQFEFTNDDIAGENVALTVDQYPSLSIGAPVSTTSQTPTEPIETQTPEGATETVAPTDTTATQVPVQSTTPNPNIITLKLKIKFQGILEKVKDEYNNLNIKVKIAGGNLSEPTDYSIGEFKIVNGDIWEGIVNFNLTESQVSAITSSKIYILIKGPKQMQKKVCDLVPTETAAGSYRCANGKISLHMGENLLDFSGIRILAGDLPEQDEMQDGIVDAYDVSYIRESLGKTDAKTLSVADLNLDGIVDSQDYSLVIAALSNRTDEE